MTDQLGETPTPLGAPEVGTDRPERPYFEEGRPRLGGSLEPIRFDATETAVIGVMADTMIPPGSGFPAPSEVGIVEFFGRYTTPTGYRTKHYPYLEEDDLKEALAALGEAFVASDSEARTSEIARLEKDAADLFGQLRSLVYYGYYAATEVTLAIRKNVPAAADYHGPPLPYGYLDSIEDWDDELLATAGQGSGYVATDDIVRVDLSKIEWLREQREDA